MLQRLSEIELPRHRVTPLDQLHLTVFFIGEVAGRDLAATIESATRAAAGLGCFSLTPRRVVSLPERGWPRLVALETDCPSPLLELHERLVRRLAQRPRSRSRERFAPHFTLCRFANDVKAERIEQPIEMPSMAITEVRVMCSELRTDGARHRTVEAIELVGPPRRPETQ